MYWNGAVPNFYSIEMEILLGSIFDVKVVKHPWKLRGIKAGKPHFYAIEDIIE